MTSAASAVHGQARSPLATLVRQTSQTRIKASLAPAAQLDEHSPISHAFQRASHVTTGSNDWVERGSWQPSTTESQYSEEEADEDEAAVSGRSSQRSRTRSARSEGTEETHSGPFAYEAYESKRRPSSQCSSGRAAGSERLSRGSAPRAPLDGEAEAVADPLETPRALVEGPDPITTPRAAGKTPPISVQIPESAVPSVRSAPPIEAPMMVTVPAAAGRVRSHTQSGTIRNFSRPSTLKDLSPESSPPRPFASTSRLLVEATAPSTSRSAPTSPATAPAPLREAASAPSSPYMNAKRAMPMHPEGFSFPPNASSPQTRLPALSRGPSAASSHDPMTPASPQRGLPDAGHWDPWRSQGHALHKSGHATQLSVGQSDFGSSEDDQRSTKSSVRSNKWRFWSRKGKSIDHRPERPPLTELAPAVQIGVSHSPLTEPEISYMRAAHRRDASDMEQHPARSPPSPQQGRDGYHGLERHDDETEMLRDPTAAPTSQPMEERVSSAMSYYSYHSVSSQGDATPLSPVQTSSHGHSSESELSPGGSNSMPSRAPGMSMQKAKDLLRAPLPNGHPATEPPRKLGEPDRVLSPDNPEDCLHLGITCHENGELERSAMFFERAAKLKGGCGMGKLLWGLTLRHGWGCAVDPAKGFAYLQKAAETVVDDLDGLVAQGTTSINESDKGTKAARAELVLSIYELGMSFRKGWGVRKDKKMALSYFELASTLGDPDAQQECGFAYLYGKGCKKDKTRAAHYYRLAAQQGVSTFGQQWIWRRKYGGTEP